MNNFVKYPTSSNNHDENNQFHCYGLYFETEQKLIFYEIPNPLNPFDELERLRNGESVDEINIENVIFNGEYIDNEIGYKDNTTNKSILDPSITFETGNSTYFLMDGSQSLLDFLNIHSGGLFIIYKTTGYSTKNGGIIYKHEDNYNGEGYLDGYIGGEY